ncbi:MAG: cell division protein FtsZ [Candidatus Cloacimonetes bacterium]|jgi:cell division protein FtsZ|nr:cell division protein FtsZ [Candidatus Cloacimonadota bacterium]MDD4155309.1 cell division protein FtsZ [Candidatus Cloacimonadota bacterium]
MVELNLDAPFSTKIKILGVGGAGGNAVNSMINSGITGVEYIVANTDAQDLGKSKAATKIHLGAKITKGLGAGADPEKGRLAAEESLEDIEKLLADTNMLFIAAGMGGGTGTGAAPVIAKKAKDMGILTLGIVSLPFDFEGLKRKANASRGIQEIQDIVDTLIVIPNNKISKIYGKVTLLDAFKNADNVITNAAQAIADIINRSGYVNVDFADVKAVMTDMGYALMGIGIADGEDRAVNAARNAIANPLLSDIDLSGCKALLINVTAGYDLMMDEFDQINQVITNETGQNGNIVSGLIMDENMQGDIKVTLIATGLLPSDAVKTLPIDAMPVKNDIPKPPLQLHIKKKEDQDSEFLEIQKRIQNANQIDTVQPSNSKTYHNQEFNKGEPPAFMKKYYN